MEQSFNSLLLSESVVSGSIHDDDTEEDPKDIEFEYDDTIMTVLDSRKNLGIRKCDVLLPNFKYKEERLSFQQRFHVSKLKGSHPHFFKKKGNGKKTSSSKSMGGGFAAKTLLKKGKELESTSCKKPVNLGRKPKKEEWIKAPQKPSPEKKKLKSDTPDEIPSSSTPNLKEVTIKNLQVGIERLHKNIVNFKYKQYKDFIDRQNPQPSSKVSDEKDKKVKKKTPKKGLKPTADKKSDKPSLKTDIKQPVPDSKSTASAKNKSKKETKSATSTKESSRLFEKFGISTDTSSSDSEQENESPVKEKKKTNTLKPFQSENKHQKKPTF